MPVRRWWLRSPPTRCRTDDLAAFDEKALTLSATAADLVVAEGDILAAAETVAASGVRPSGYQVAVDIARS